MYASGREEASRASGRCAGCAGAAGAAGAPAFRAERRVAWRTDRQQASPAFAFAHQAVELQRCAEFLGREAPYATPCAPIVAGGGGAMRRAAVNAHAWRGERAERYYQLGVAQLAAIAVGGQRDGTAGGGLATAVCCLLSGVTDCTFGVDAAQQAAEDEAARSGVVAAAPLPLGNLLGRRRVPWCRHGRVLGAEEGLRRLLDHARQLVWILRTCTERRERSVTSGGRVELRCE